MTPRDISALHSLAAKLAPKRWGDDPIFNDLFEAADDWGHFAESLQSLETWHDVSGRLKQEVELYGVLRDAYGERIDADADFSEIMALGAKIIAAAQAHKPDPDGYLSCNVIVRESFKFLETEFGFVAGEAPDGSWRYASDHVLVDLEFPGKSNSDCWIKQVSDPSSGFLLEYIIFMATGERVSLGLLPGLVIDTEAKVRAWFELVATILRRDGADLLRDRPGAFEALAAATAELDRQITAENDRLYGSGGIGAG